MKIPAIWYDVRNMIKAHIQINSIQRRGSKIEYEGRDKKLRAMLKEFENPTSTKVWPIRGH